MKKLLLLALLVIMLAGMAWSIDDTWKSKENRKIERRYTRYDEDETESDEDESEWESDEYCDRRCERRRKNREWEKILKATTTEKTIEQKNISNVVHWPTLYNRQLIGDPNKTVSVRIHLEMNCPDNAFMCGVIFLRLKHRSNPLYIYNLASGLECFENYSFENLKSRNENVKWMYQRAFELSFESINPSKMNQYEIEAVLYHDCTEMRKVNRVTLALYNVSPEYGCVTQHLNYGNVPEGYEIDGLSDRKKLPRRFYSGFSDDAFLKANNWIDSEDTVGKDYKSVETARTMSETFNRCVYFTPYY